MNAKKCDRCGTYYKDNIVDVNEPFRYEIMKDNHPYEGVTKMDLCDYCRADFLRWLNKPQETDTYNRW